MPIDLEIDHGRRLAVATARGALVLRDVTRYFARLVSDATLSYRKIFDGRDARLFATPDDARAWVAGVFGSPADPCPQAVRSVPAMSSPPKPVLTPRMARLQAQKARRLASALLSPGDRERLLSYARELEERAAQLEAADAPAANPSESS